MRAIKKTVLIAGATGYLGRHLISAYHAAGYRVVALARRPEALIGLDKHIDEVVYGEATKPETLGGVMKNVNLVVSALGITSQKDSLSFAQVDYQANRNLLDAALESGVAQFLYVHVKNAEQMPGVEMAAAKARFAAELDAADIHSTIVAPSGFFSDLVEVLDMARKGRVHLFGDGKALISPIDGHDLAAACVAASEEGTPRIEVGGPQTLSLNDIAEWRLPQSARRLASPICPSRRFAPCLMQPNGSASVRRSARLISSRQPRSSTCRRLRTVRASSRCSLQARLALTQHNKHHALDPGK